MEEEVKMKKRSEHNPSDREKELLERVKALEATMGNMSELHSPANNRVTAAEVVICIYIYMYTYVYISMYALHGREHSNLSMP